MENIKKIIAIILLALFGGGIISAQTLVKVSGIVTSADDGLPMIGVGVMAGPGNGVITSLDGEYSIEAAPGTTLVFRVSDFRIRQLSCLRPRLLSTMW